MAGAGCWTDERVALLKALWAKGLSGTTIARQLATVGEPPPRPITRSSVIGKVYRLRLPIRGKATPVTQAKRKRKKLAVVNGRPPSAFGKLQALLGAHPLPPPRATDVPRKTLLELEDGDCRFPCTGEPPHMFCAAPRALGLPYCAAHALRAYQPPEPRRPAPSFSPRGENEEINEKIEVARAS